MVGGTGLARGVATQDRKLILCNQASLPYDLFSTLSNVGYIIAYGNDCNLI